MWKVEYTKRFLKELSKLPKDIQVQAEKIVFDELLKINPFELGYLERMSYTHCLFCRWRRHKKANHG
jgi:mRNA-degrading endonuclease RelE of RelBE toxin-antitoxin system